METFEDIRYNLIILGTALHQKQILSIWQRSLDLVRVTQKPLRVLFLFGINRTFSAGKGSYIHELLENLGAKNLAASSHSKWPCLTKEYILNSQPDLLIVAVAKKNMVLGSCLDSYKQDPFWKTLDVVKNGRLVFVDEDEFLTPGPGVLIALRVLRDCLTFYQPEG